MQKTSDVIFARMMKAAGPMEHVVEHRLDGRKRADQVREKILALIRDRGLAEGDKLPTEPQLVEIFGVGRSSVRDAMQSLVGLGIVDMRPGRGAYVGHLTLNDVVRIVGGAIKLDYAAAHQLHEARAMIEVTAARLAAKRHTATDLAQMQDTIGNYRNAWEEDDLDAMVAADLAFHAAIIHAARNDVLETMLASIASLLYEQRRQYALAMLDARGDEVLAGHAALLDAIAVGDPKKAEQEAKRHMRSVSAQIDSIATRQPPTVDDEL